MQFCPSFHIVQLIKSGRSPQQACEEVVAHMKTSNVSFEVGVVAVNTKVLCVYFTIKCIAMPTMLFSVVLEFDGCM